MKPQLQLRTAKARSSRRAAKNRAYASSHKLFAHLRVLRAFAVCSSFSFACGYVPVRAQPSGGLRMAAVRNATAQAEAGGLFAEAFRAELAGVGRLDADGAPTPELLLQIVSLASVPSGSSGEGATSFRLNAVLALKVGDYEDVLRPSEDYLAGVDVLGTEANRAIERYDVAMRLR